MRVVCALAAVMLLGACSAFSVEPVKPWQRGVLSLESMQLQPDKMEGYADDHIYFSKEAATGGKGVGGGGCGCN